MRWLFTWIIRFRFLVNGGELLNLRFPSPLNSFLGCGEDLGVLVEEVGLLGFSDLALPFPLVPDFEFPLPFPLSGLEHSVGLAG